MLHILLGNLRIAPPFSPDLHMQSGTASEKAMVSDLINARYENLDPALLHRPSRFDRIWKFPLPAIEQRLALLRKHGSTYFSEPILRDVAERTNGFSMTYVQEVIVNALLDSAHNGTSPNDSNLIHSLETIRLQRRSASKGVESLEQQDNVGFCVANQVAAHPSLPAR